MANNPVENQDIKRGSNASDQSKQANQSNLSGKSDPQKSQDFAKRIEQADRSTDQSAEVKKEAPKR